MNSSQVNVSVDTEADAAYVSVCDHAVVRTVAFAPDVMIDLDDANTIVGIEFLTLAAEVDVDTLVRDYPTASDFVDVLRNGVVIGG